MATSGNKLPGVHGQPSGLGKCSKLWIKYSSVMGIKCFYWNHVYFLSLAFQSGNIFTGVSSIHNADAFVSRHSDIGIFILFSEPTTLFQLMGIVLAFLILPLAGREPIQFDLSGKKALSGIKWGLFLFVAYGITDFMFKIQAEFIPSTEPKAFMTGIFATALVLSLPYLKKDVPSLMPCLFWGVILGLSNMLATYFWIRTLQSIPGTVAYPTLGIGVILMTTLATQMLWKEKLRLANYSFLILACIAVLLINIGG